MKFPFESVLVAARGDVARRIGRTLRAQGLGNVAVHAEPDRYAPHVLEADRAVCVGPASADKSYANAAALIDAARIAGAGAIHPGRGFLSENTAFAGAVEAAGLVFLGPTATQIHRLRNAQTLRELARSAGVPPPPQSAWLESLSPGKTRTPRRARRITLPIFGDGRGNVVALPERDGSARRPSCLFLEECPAPQLDARARDAMRAAAIALGRAVDYRSAGSAEFLYDVERGAFWLLEFHTHLDLGHALCEAVTGVDLVEWMLALTGSEPRLFEAPEPRGHAIGARLDAYEAGRDFQRSSGTLTEARLPPAELARVETGYERGVDVPIHYDSRLAHLVVVGPTREEAVERARQALDATRLDGVPNTLALLRRLVRERAFVAGEVTTGSFASALPARSELEVLAPGAFTLVVDHPGRLGYWHVGVPPSGPMDPLALRLGNRIVGNDERAAGLELTLHGPTLRFSARAVIALSGAAMEASLDTEPAPFYRPLEVAAGQTLRLGRVSGAGLRTYLAVRGGLDVPEYLGSRTTFTLGGFGGHAGRTLRRGDSVPFGATPPVAEPRALAPESVPRHARRWEIGVLYGPHAAPDFFTERDIETVFSTEWEVHHNSSRTGVRLIGPKPAWARPDGGEAGLHPSNIHDVAYAVGAVDFTGDMPILLGPDGPSLGGFVCPATIVTAELWKLGQLAPGDRVRLVPIAHAQAAELEAAEDRLVATLGETRMPALRAVEPGGAVSAKLAATAERVEVVYRRAGDQYLLVEYGPPLLDLGLRFRAHALMQWLSERHLAGVIDLTPGIRSLQVHYDGSRLPFARLLHLLQAAEDELGRIDDVTVASRILYLPLSWDDPATRLAIARYMRSVHPNAPWCPSNIEFIRRINGLDSIEEVREIVFGASYLVLGLGDVYLGAPVATPVDPRHRLVTTKYNPARTWTPENAVGIGGAYLCIYGMEGPGGYQFVGRTLQVFNRLRQTRHFSAAEPWLLRFFDQIRFYPVGADELLEMREAFLHGRVELRIEETSFRLADHERLLTAERAGIARFKARQQAAFEAERERWIESGQLGGAHGGRAEPEAAAFLESSA